MTRIQLRTPVALFIFNRPETTNRIFAEVAKAKPTTLLLVADGPRAGRPDDTPNCALARSIIERVDWDCDVMTNYSDVNLGCKRRVSSGLDWVFGLVNEAIILEDDCLPHPSFFRFCAELLERYRDDERVMHIGGSNFQLGRRYGDASYYFSRYPHVWGWASWRRAWELYDLHMKLWRLPEDKVLYLQQFADSRERRFWQQTWDVVQAGKIDTWDYQWAFACIAHGGLSVVPNVNLVSNIGFGVQATHTGSQSLVAGLPTVEMAFPLRHPECVVPCHDADANTSRLFFQVPSMMERLLAKVRLATTGVSSAWGWKRFREHGGSTIPGAPQIQ